MSDISITGVTTLKAFLDGVEEPRRQQAAVFMAARAALRVAPLLYDLIELSGEQYPSRTPLPVFRALLISSVAATMPSDDIRSAAAEAAAANTFGEAKAAAAAAFAANSVAFETYNGAHFAAETLSFVSKALDANAIIWPAIQRDAVWWMEHADAQTGSLSIDVLPLWDSANPLAEKLSTLQSRVWSDASGADWSFWINWYQGILDGTPQNWHVLHHIATTPHIRWGDHAMDVNNRIMLLEPALEELKRLQGEVVDLEEKLEESQDEARAYEAKLRKKSANEELSGVLDAWEDRAKSADCSSRIYLIVIGLVIAALVAGAIYVIVCVEFERLDALLIPSGCANLAIDACVGLTQRTAFLTVIFLTLASVIFLVLRILLRAYNSNIFWRDDARERIAFATVYINMLGNTTTSQKTDDYARIVYETLFRAANSKMPVEDVSVGLSISDNLAKSLVK